MKDSEKQNIATHTIHEHLHRHVSIWLDSYDDVFSDFDPRSYGERNISDDFLTELKKVCHESEHHISELKLLVPPERRLTETEQVITTRLHEHFLKSNHHFQKELKTVIRQGWILTISGMVIMLLAGTISYKIEEGFLKHILVVMLEPAGWFTVWAGLDNLFFTARKQKSEFAYYRKLSRSKIIFEDLKESITPKNKN